MAGKNGAGNTRRILILIIAVCDAVSTAALALFHDSMERGLAVALGYAILFLTATLMNFCIAGKATSIKEISALVFSIVLLALVISAIAFILFNADDDTTPMFHAEEEERPFVSHPGMGLSYNEDDTAEEEEDVINIPSPPTVFNTITIDKVANDIPEPSEILITERDDEIMIPSVPEVFGMVRDVDRESEVSIPSEPEVFGLIRDAKNTEEPAAVPSVPEMFGVIREVDKDSAAPIVPVIIPEESTDEEPTSSGSTSESFGFSSGYDDDFWSSFYIAGEDELDLPDGIYYFDFYINQQIVGTIESTLSSGKVSISKNEFSEYTSGNIVDELFDSIMSYQGAYIPLEYIGNLGVLAEFDSGQYSVSLTFSAEDMPVQILSIRGTSSGGIYRPIAGGITLDPAFFVLRSRWSLSALFRSGELPDWSDALRFTFSSSHYGRISDVYFNVGFNMNFRTDEFIFNMGSYKFYKDFQEQMIRLSWGNIGSDLLSPAGTAFGIGFYRDYSYGSPSVRRKSHVERTLLIDKESRVLVYNEGNEIFNKVLQPGNYRLRDFVLYSGANEILIRIEPLDGSMPTEQTITLSYASSLLAPGEVFYGASLTTGRQVVRSKAGDNVGVVYLPLGDEYLRYDIKNLTLSGYVEAGLTESLTMHSTLALQNYPTASLSWNPRVRFNTELTHANVLGVTRYNLNLREEFNKEGKFGIPGIYARIGHQVSTGWSPISSVSFSFTYSNPEENRVDNRHRLSLSGSLSGRFGFMSWSTSLSGTMYTDIPERFTYSASASLSFSIARNFWMSGSISLSSTGLDIPAVRGSMYATYRFSGGSATASTAFNDISVSANVGNNKHSATASISTDRFNSLDGYDISAGYSYNGTYFDFDLDADSTLAFRNVDVGMEVSTQTVFADGLFAIGSSIPSNFLLISQKGNLRGNELSAGSVGSSSTNVLKPVFGTYLYTGLSSSRGTSFSLYSNNPESFNGADIFDINVPYSDINGYILRLSAENLYSVSGVVVLPDGSLWTNGSSPLYRYSEEEGTAVLEITENYAFTDSDGRFLISDLASGQYAFDVNYNDEWILLIFSVTDYTDMPYGVQILNATGSVENSVLPSVYSDSVVYTLDDVLTGNEFWAMVYPEMEVAV